MLEVQIMKFTEQLYDELEEGMFFQEVCERIGDNPGLISSTTQQIEPGIKLMQQTTDLYEWIDDNENAIRGLFVMGQLREKTNSYGTE
jgi:hypothetical protein